MPDMVLQDSMFPPMDFVCVLVVFMVSSTQPRVREEGTSIEEFLIDDWYGWAQPTVGGTILRQGGLGYTWKQAEHNPVNKPLSSVPHGYCFSVSTLSSCSDFHQWWIVTWNYKLNKPIPHQVAFGYHSNKEAARNTWLLFYTPVLPFGIGMLTLCHYMLEVCHWVIMGHSLENSHF